MNLLGYGKVASCLTENLDTKWKVKLHFCLLSGKGSRANVWFINCSFLIFFFNFLLTLIFISSNINVDVITYTNCDMNVCSKPVIMKYICKNTLKHINKNNWTLYGTFDIKLVSFPGSPVSFSKVKIFQPSPLGLLVPAVVRRIVRTDTGTWLLH